MLPREIPLQYRLAAYWQWFLVFIPFSVGVLLTYFPMGLLVAATARYTREHPQGKRTVATHDPDYAAAGSSGAWGYWNSPHRWLRPWNNYEDGTFGEPSGKTSARVGGDEDSIWNQYLWLCRNPFNWAKRSSRFFACFVNDCDLDWWGSYNLTDKAPVVAGWYFCRAVDRTTGRVYYGYRQVRLNDDGTVYQATFGYKIKPVHQLTLQDKDDLDKAFTLRIQFASEAD